MKLKGVELEGAYRVVYYATSFVILDEKGNGIYFEDRNGYWSKGEYDEKGNQIYFEDSKDYWAKSEYDGKGNRTYFEDSSDYWVKWEYNKEGTVSYYENSIGEILDERVKELTIEEIEKLLGYKIKIRGK